MTAGLPDRACTLLYQPAYDVYTQCPECAAMGAGALKSECRVVLPDCKMPTCWQDANPLARCVWRHPTHGVSGAACVSLWDGCGALVSRLCQHWHNYCLK